MALIEYYNMPLGLTCKSPGGVNAQLASNAPELFSNKKAKCYAACCLLDINLEPLREDMVQSLGMMPDRISEKFSIAVRSKEFGWFRIEQCLVFVVALPDVLPDDEHLAIDSLSTAMEDFVSIVEADFGLNITVSISPIFRTSDKCIDAVRDALVFADFASFIDKPVSVVDLLYYQGMKRFLSRQTPEYRLVNYERPIIAAVLNRNFVHAELIVNKLLVAHLCDPIQIFPTTRNSMVNVIRLVMSMATIDPKELSDAVSSLPELMDSIRICPTLEEMKQQIHQIFQTIQDSLNQNKDNNATSEKMMRVIDFVNDNYKNPMFDASMVSDKFDITPSYLSRAFKEQVGVNLSAYLQTVRITAAKDLLVNTEYTVERIATEVGYVGGQNLLRLFKKYEGISPTEYRVLIRSTGG